MSLASMTQRLPSGGLGKLSSAPAVNSKKLPGMWPFLFTYARKAAVSVPSTCPCTVWRICYRHCGQHTAAAQAAWQARLARVVAPPATGREQERARGAGESAGADWAASGGGAGGGRFFLWQPASKIAMPIDLAKCFIGTCDDATRSFRRRFPLH